MSQTLPYDEIKFDRNVKLGHIINTPEENDIVSYFIAVDLKNPVILKKKLRISPLFLKINFVLKMNLVNI